MALLSARISEPTGGRFNSWARFRPELLKPLFPRRFRLRTPHAPTQKSGKNNRPPAEAGRKAGARRTARAPRGPARVHARPQELGGLRGRARSGAAPSLAPCALVSRALRLRFRKRLLTASFVHRGAGTASVNDRGLFAANGRTGFAHGDLRGGRRRRTGTGE